MYICMVGQGHGAGGWTRAGLARDFDLKQSSSRCHTSRPDKG